MKKNIFALATIGMLFLSSFMIVPTVGATDGGPVIEAPSEVNETENFIVRVADSANPNYYYANAEITVGWNDETYYTSWIGEVVLLSPEVNQDTDYTITADVGSYDPVSVWITILDTGTPNEPPTANFTHSINDLTVTFNASSSNDTDGTIVEYLWNFGDGTTGNGMVVNHNYTDTENEEEAIYNVTLKVTDYGGKNDSISKNITVLNNLPIANFTYTVEGKTVKFVSTSKDVNGTIVNHTWDLGDGNYSYESEFVHTYGAEYTKYKVTLIVNDSAGASSDPKSENVTTDDGTPPTISIDKPIRKGIYINDDYKITRIRMGLIIGDITIEVNATDINGSGVNASTVKVHIDDNKLRPFAKQIINTTADPDRDGIYTCHWEKLVIFRFLHVHTIKVTAMDYAGNPAESETILVRRIL